MILFKACPKCHGDLQVQADTFGRYVTCLQCGFLKDLNLPTAKAHPRQEEKELAAAGPRRKAA